MKPLTFARKALRAHARATRITMLASGLTGTLTPLAAWATQAISLVRQRNEATVDSPEYADGITIPNPIEWARNLTGPWHWLTPAITLLGALTLSILAATLIARLTRTRHDPHAGDKTGDAETTEPTESTPPAENRELPPGATDDYGPELD
ncbi:hypothetical protein ACLUWO_05145 [Pseudoscardovia radai]|uniref:hypothetical protein n=1 Tax=Pseudoscardovia radai TaxID=987066 RepID=UPI003995421F